MHKIKHCKDDRVISKAGITTGAVDGFPVTCQEFFFDRDNCIPALRAGIVDSHISSWFNKLKRPKAPPAPDDLEAVIAEAVSVDFV